MRWTASRSTRLRRVAGWLVQSWTLDFRSHLWIEGDRRPWSRRKTKEGEIAPRQLLERGRWTHLEAEITFYCELSCRLALCFRFSSLKSAAPCKTMLFMGKASTSAVGEVESSNSGAAGDGVDSS